MRGEMTLSEILNDPLIRQIMKADGVTVAELTNVMQAAAVAREKGATGAILCASCATGQTGCESCNDVAMV
jgi:hypothetical protein